MRLGSPRVLGLAAVALVVAGWLLGSTLSPPVARSQERAPSREIAVGPSLQSIVPLTRLATRVAVPAPSPARNPFVFGRGPREHGAAVGAPAAEEPASAVESPSGDGTAVDEWRLLGLAIGADGVTTAIVRGRGDVHLARAGDRLAEDVEVGDVSDTGVRLRRADGSTIDLRLP